MYQWTAVHVGCFVYIQVVLLSDFVAWCVCVCVRACCGVWRWLWFRHWKPAVPTSIALYPLACCRGDPVVISVTRCKQTLYHRPHVQLHMCFCYTTSPQRWPQQDDCGCISQCKSSLFKLHRLNNEQLIMTRNTIIIVLGRMKFLCV